MKRDTELWLLVREIRSEYRKMAAMMAKWGYQLEDAESKLRAILDDPDARDLLAENRSAASSSDAALLDGVKEFARQLAEK